MGHCAAHRREQEALTEALAVEFQLRHWAQTVVAASDGRCVVQHCAVRRYVAQRYVVQRWGVPRHRLHTGVEREPRWAVDVHGRPGILRVETRLEFPGDVMHPAPGQELHVREQWNLTAAVRQGGRPSLALNLVRSWVSQSSAAGCLRNGRRGSEV